MSLFLLVTVRSHRSGTSVLGECRASQLSASRLFFKDITRGLSFSQVCEEISLCCQPGCCLGQGSKYSLLPAWDTVAPSSAVLRKGLHGCALWDSTVLPAEHCAASRAVPALHRVQGRHTAQPWESWASSRLFSQRAAALSSRCFLSTALRVQRSASEFHLGRKKF